MLKVIHRQEGKYTMRITVSPLSVPGIIIGLIIQTCYGWTMPVNWIGLFWMVFHIFLMPTMLTFALITVLMFIVVVFGLFLKK